MGRKKVIIFGSYAPSLILFRLQLLRRIAQSNCEVIAIAPEITPPVKKQLESCAIRCHSISLDRTGQNLFLDLLTCIRLRRFLVQEKPDVLLSYTIKPVIYGAIMAKFVSIPAIFSMITGLGYTFGASTYKQRILSALVKKLYRISLKYNKNIFFQNPDDMKLFQDIGLASKEQSILINGSGVDLEYFQVTDIPEKISFLLIARLIKDKGIYEYIKAAQCIKKKYPGTIFYLAGWVDKSPAAINRTDLDKWVKDGVVKFLGKLDDVRPALSKTAVYVLPSYREGTPHTVLEAMAMGRPIITTDVPGCRETVRHGGNGFLVPARQSCALADAMERFVLDPQLVETLGKESRMIAEEKYDVHDVNNKILKTIGVS